MRDATNKGRRTNDSPITARQLELLTAIATRTSGPPLCAADAGRLVKMGGSQASTTLCALELRGLIELTASGWVVQATDAGRLAVAAGAKGRAA